MKATIKRPLNIIQLSSQPDDIARLEKITSDGVFIYKIRYLVDPVKATNANALKVKIHVSEKPYIKKIVPTFSKQKPRSIINSLLLRASKVKDLARTEKNDYLITIISDISSKIPNDQTRNLSRINLSDSNKVSLGSLIKIRPIAVSQLDSDNINVPILEMNLNKRSSDSDVFLNNQQLRTLANNLLDISNTDPADLFNSRTNALLPASKAMSGVRPNLSFLQNQRINRDVRKTNMIKSLLNNINVSSRSDISVSDFINVPHRLERNLLEIEEEIRIPISALVDGDFYIIFELFNDKNLSVQIVSSLINHARNLKLLKLPTVPPSVKMLSIYKPGKVSFEITQLDRNSIGVNIYRKEIKPGIPRFDAIYTYVGKVNVGYNRSERVDDIVATIHPVIYRFVPFSDEENQAAIFTSKVAKFDRKSAIKKEKEKRRPSFGVLNYDIKEKSIEVEIKDIPPDVIALELLRRDLSIKQKQFSRVKSTVFLINSTSNTPIIVDDPDVKPNRIYEYIVKYIFKNGDIEIASNNLVIEFDPILSNILSLSLSNLNVTNFGDNLDVTFTIGYTTYKNNFELLKQFIQDQNLLSEYQNNVTDDKFNLSKLFAFSVKRLNISTGDLENFGIVSSTNFSDRSMGLIRNVKPLQPGFEYKYIVTAFFRNPETMFPKLERTVKFRNLTHTFKPNKWHQPLTLKDGAILTDRSVKNNHAKDQYEQGQVADIQSINASLANILPSIAEGRATQVRDKAVLIQWKVEGDITKIDHFIIVLKSLGIRTIIGAAHNISNSNYFEFLDTLTNGESGALTYQIIPVYYDFSRGTELKTNQVVI